eukprot:scaffold103933_cov19-Tisochrysis_lutea.AAC.2
MRNIGQQESLQKQRAGNQQPNESETCCKLEHQDQQQQLTPRGGLQHVGVQTSCCSTTTSASSSCGLSCSSRSRNVRSSWGSRHSSRGSSRDVSLARSNSERHLGGERAVAAAAAVGPSQHRQGQAADQEDEASRSSMQDVLDGVQQWLGFAVTNAWNSTFLVHVLQVNLQEARLSMQFNGLLSTNARHVERGAMLQRFVEPLRVKLDIQMLQLQDMQAGRKEIEGLEAQAAWLKTAPLIEPSFWCVRAQRATERVPNEQRFPDKPWKRNRKGKNK